MSFCLYSPRFQSRAIMQDVGLECLIENVCKSLFEIHGHVEVLWKVLRAACGPSTPHVSASVLLTTCRLL